MPTRITGLTKARPQPCVTARSCRGRSRTFHRGDQSPEACQLADPALRASGKIGCECRPSGPARAAGAGSTGSNPSGFLHNANFA